MAYKAKTIYCQAICRKSFPIPVTEHKPVEAKTQKVRRETVANRTFKSCFKKAEHWKKSATLLKYPQIPLSLISWMCWIFRKLVPYYKPNRSTIG